MQLRLISDIFFYGAGRRRWLRLAGLVGGALGGAGLWGSGEEVGELAPMEVYGTPAGRYGSGETTAWKMAVEGVRLPLSVTVIPEQVMLDQDARELSDALRNVAGLGFSDGFGNTKEDYFLRGFRRDGNYHEDGYNVANQGKADLAGVERVEVIKGPASLMYGRVAPGGLVNAVLKRPEGERRFFSEVTWSDRGERRGLVDATGPLEGGWGYRLVASLEDSESWKEGAHGVAKRYFAPMISWEGRRTQLLVRASWQDHTLPFDRGAVFDRATVSEPGTIYYHYFGFPDDFFSYTTRRVSVDVRQEVAEGWSVSFQGAYENNYGEDQYSQIAKLSAATAKARTGNPAAPAGFYRYLRSNRERDDEGRFADLRLEGETRWGGFEHRLLVGLQSIFNERNQVHINNSAVNGAYVDQTPVDLNQPSHEPHGRTLQPGVAGTYALHEPQEEFAVYLGDLATAGRWTLLGGLRWVRYDFQQEIVPVTPPTLAAQDGNVPALSSWLGQAGALYELAPGWNLFGSYGESFLPQRVNDAGNPEINEEPRTARQWEGGVKYSAREGRLAVTASCYHLEERNIATDTGLDDGFGNPIYGLLEGAEVQGVELESRITFLRGLNLLGSYAYTHGEQKTGSNAGKDLAVVAEHSASLWASYERAVGKSRLLGAGLGAFYVGDRPGNNANTITVAGYTTLDFRAWYYLGRWKAKLGVTNLTDEEYIQGFAAIGDVATNNSNLNVGTPRTVTAGLSYAW